MNRGGLESRDQKHWTRHGSTRKLWKEADVAAALHYVVHDQGELMAVFYDPAAVLRIESELEKAAERNPDPDKSRTCQLSSRRVGRERHNPLADAQLGSLANYHHCMNW